jgi:DNA-damage-inducible protein J
MDTVVRARVNEADKAAAAAVLRELGLTISDLLRMAVIRTARNKQIPFEIGLAATNRAVIRNIEEGLATKASHAVDMESPKSSPFVKRRAHKK